MGGWVDAVGMRTDCCGGNQLNFGGRRQALKGSAADDD